MAPTTPPKKRIALIGPMTGRPHFNAHAFNEAHIIFDADGWEVMNPVTVDIATYGAGLFDTNPDGDIAQAKRDYGFNRRLAMAGTLGYIARHAQAVYHLKGWETSGGAKVEHALAELLQLDCLYQTEPF